MSTTIAKLEQKIAVKDEKIQQYLNEKMILHHNS